MKKGILFGVGLLALGGVIQPVMAADPARGKVLYDKGCDAACHAAKEEGKPEAIFLRANRKDSLEKLQAQVSFCNQQVLKSEWFPEDEADVVAYLNETFYHFK